MMSKLSFAACTRFAMAFVLGLSQPALSHAKVGNPNNRRAQATEDGTPKYQRFPYYWPHCPDGFDITSQEECSEAIAYLGVTVGRGN